MFQGSFREWTSTHLLLRENGKIQIPIFSVTTIYLTTSPGTCGLCNDESGSGAGGLPAGRQTAYYPPDQQRPSHCEFLRVAALVLGAMSQSTSLSSCSVIAFIQNLFRVG